MTNTTTPKLSYEFAITFVINSYQPTVKLYKTKIDHKFSNITILR